MPLWKWTVEPIYLSRGTKKCEVDDVLVTTCNHTLVTTLHQLTCLLRLAHYVFSDIGEQCEGVYKRTESLRNRVEECCKSSQTLNARRVVVPVGDIDWYCQVKDHYISTYVQEAELIVPSTRPIYVRQLYEKAAATPLPLIRVIDRYRTDGIRGSKIFTRKPVLGETAKKNKHLDIETRRPASFALARDWDDLDITFLKNEYSGPCQRVAPSRDILADLSRLPSPEERTLAMSLEYPSSMVPIDITGNNFQRMSSLRRSLLHVDFFIKRKKQKKNKRRNTISGNTSKELEEALKATTSKGLVDISCQTDDCSEIGWFGKIFNKRNSLIKREKKSPPEENNNVLSKLAASVRNRDSVNLFDSIESSKSSKKSERNSLVIKEKSESGATKKSPSTNKNKIRSILPISTLSAAMTVAVKMRQGKKNGDDGRSSSGNWSASSSTRVSVDSDQQHATSSSNGACSPSQSSLGKDSVLSDYTPQDTDTSRSQEGSRTSRSTDRRPMSLVSPKNITEDTTETWIQSLEQECQSGTLTPENCSESTSTPQVLSPYIRRRRYCQNESSPPIIDDEGSSVYSVDTDGYYTSMHTDSGLKTRTLQHENSNRERRDSISSVSTIGNVSVNSLLSRATIGRSSKSDSFREERKRPPPPPIRVSSVKKDSGSDGTSSQNNGDTSTSESSDRDTVERLRKKTAINSSRYPSMCAVSPEPSDDESTKPKLLTEPIKEKTPPKINMYYDQSPQNSKFISILRRSKSPEEALLERNQNLVTSFSSECTEQHPSKEITKDKSEEIKSHLDTPTSTIFTEEGRSTIKRIVLSNSNKSNQSKSCSLIPTAVNKPIARVTLDPNGRVIYASNSLGRKRDGHPLRSSSISPIPEQRFATLPMRNAHSISSQPIVAHNGTFVRVNVNSAIKSPIFNHKTNNTSVEEKLNLSALKKKEIGKTEINNGYRRPLCGPRLPMNGYKPTSVTHKIFKNSNDDNSPLSNGPLPEVPPQMPPLSRFANQHSSNRNSDFSSNRISNRINGAQNVPSSTSVQNSLRSIATYSPYQSSVYGGVPNLKPISPSMQSTSKMMPRPNVLFPHSKTSSLLNSSYSKLPQRINSPLTPDYSSANSTQKQVSFSTSPPSSITPNNFYCNSSSSVTPNSFYCNSPSSVTPNSFYSSSLTSPSSLTSSSTLQNISRNSMRPSTSSPSMSIQQNGLISPNLYYNDQQPKRSYSFSPSSLQSYSPFSSVTSSPNASSFNSMSNSTLQNSPDRISSSNDSQYSVMNNLQNNVYKSAHRISPTPSSRSISPSPYMGSSQTPNKIQLTKIQSPISSGTEKKTMTAADLFAAIHNSKKKHNIKTDLDISSSSLSSRSSSPCNSVTSGKSVLAETGFLSPRNQLNTPRDRRSWIGDSRSSSLPPSDRKGLANDRLKPSKPTSMYDFKMLLLQASRSANDSPGARASASERLKIQNRSEMDNTSHSLPTSPIRTPTPIFSGHSTVPIKRGSKTRASLRYDLMYQPILEDCCEESEAQKSPKTPPSRTPLETSFVNSTPNCANHLPPPQHWTEPFVPIRTANSRGASTWV